MKNKGDLERECDALKAELDNYNNKVQVLERTVEHLKKTIDEKVFRAVNSFIYKIMRPSYLCLENTETSFHTYDRCL